MRSHTERGPTFEAPSNLKKLLLMLVIGFAFSVLTASAKSPGVETETSAALTSAAEASAMETPAAKTAVAETPAAQTSSAVPGSAEPGSTKPSTAASKPDLQIPDGWQVFTPPAGDFRVLMPANVKRRTDNKTGRPQVMYYQQANDIDFLVADGSYMTKSRNEGAQFDYYQEAVNTIEQQLNQKHKSLVTKEVSDVTGQGWHGKQISFKTNDADLATVRVVYSTAGDVAYKLLASAGTDNPIVRTYFDSFEIDSTVASKAHLDSASSASVRNFVDVVWAISIAVLGVVMLALIVSAIKNRKG